MITIVDYGLGNVGAFANTYKRMDLPVRIARTADDLASAERIILPGVGAFDHAMDLLDGSGMRDTLEDLVVNKKRPVIGVCVGMQMLGEGSDEGVRAGLGWISGRVRHFRHGLCKRPVSPRFGSCPISSAVRARPACRIKSYVLARPIWHPCWGCHGSGEWVVS